MESPTSFGTTHNLSYQQLVFFALNDARIAFVNNRDLHRHVLVLWTYARPLAQTEPEWLGAWEKLRNLDPSSKASFETRHRQLVLLTDLFWKKNILSLRGVPYAEMGDVTRVPGSGEEQEEWEI
jgi:hypothetical protein